MTIRARIFLTVVCAAGLAVCAFAATHWSVTDPLRFSCYFVLAMLAAGLKVRLPGITGTMSVIFLFLLLGVIELSFGETLIIGCCGSLIQCLWRPKSTPRPIQILFSLCAMSISVGAAYASYWYAQQILLHSQPLLLALCASAFFLTNTLQVAAVVSLTERKPFVKTWFDCYFWSFPYFLAGAAIVGILATLNRWTGWQTTLLVLPVVYWIYRSYHLYLGKMEDDKRYVEEMASLHLRTIEALALAIDAKDHTTHEHLRRVRVYAAEMGKHLNMSPSELDALRAAALLHDIGKLAVPEHIISKPGKLTPEEFEKIKIHPVVGAEILQRVQFPYSVVPIVRHHHEKWDGTGYPDGISGSNIPLGARIIAAVDCLDALASDRQYRRALPLFEAMGVVMEESGRSFDPSVVSILKDHYVEFERLAQEQPLPEQYLSTELKVERGEAPAAGFEKDGTESLSAASDGSSDFLTQIAAARSEAQMLMELSQDLGNSLSLDETLSVLAVRLKRLIPHDAIAIYLRKKDVLIPEFVGGENSKFFSSLKIPMGQGVSGWVAENRKPILNGNPSVESAYTSDASRFTSLHSALSIPLEGPSEVVAVLTLYDAGKDAFTKDHLRVLLAVASKTAFYIENTVKFRGVEKSATVDFLTGLPNARSLYLHLESELARAKRTNSRIAILVCDLDGLKEVNNRFGHLVGNGLLKRFSEKLTISCHKYDYVARMGGDEFVLIYPDLEPLTVEDKYKNLLRLAETATLEVCGSKLLSLSVGHAFYPDDAMDAENLLTVADRMMNVAKRQRGGKAVVEIHKDEDTNVLSVVPERTS